MTPARSAADDSVMTTLLFVLESKPQSFALLFRSYGVPAG